MRIFDRIDNGKYIVIPSSNFEGFHSMDQAGHLKKLYPNESGILDCF